MLFSVYAVPSFQRFRVGRDAAGNPALLITVLAATVNEGSRAPTVLEHLRAEHNVSCRVTHSDGTTEQGDFTVITCTSNDLTLRSYFLHVSAAMVAVVGPEPSRPELDGALNNLVELFRSLGRPPRKTVQGIWAELFLIARARDPETLVSAWHATAGDRYDFGAGAERIEVKSTSRRLRQHHFSLEQLRPPAGTRVLIGSVFVERSGGGTSLGDLVETVHQLVTQRPSLILRVQTVVAETLGSSFLSALDDRFDRELAEESLAFYDAVKVPRPPGEMPVGVSEVHFTSDLSGAAAISLSNYKNGQGLLAAAVPTTRRG